VRLGYEVRETILRYAERRDATTTARIQAAYIDASAGVELAVNMDAITSLGQVDDGAAASAEYEMTKGVTG
jgi:hypothetical protein